MHSSCVKQHTTNHLQYILMNTMNVSTQQRKDDTTLQYNKQA